MRRIQPEYMGEFPLDGFELDKTQMNRLIWGDIAVK